MKVPDEVVNAMSVKRWSPEQMRTLLQQVVEIVEAGHRVDVLRVTRMISDKIGTTSNYTLLLNVQNELLQIARQELPDE